MRLATRAFLFMAAASMILANGCTGPLRQDTPCTVAVWEVENLGQANRAFSDVGPLLSARILETFQASGRCHIVERQKLEQALTELNLGSSQLTDESTRLKIGNIAGARNMVFGAYQVLGKTMRLDLRLIDVSTGSVLASANQTASADDITQWLQASEKAARELEHGF
jgi:curli biogenesis system outer membrane secretion channel CsgG